MDVGEWLRGLGLAQYETVFRENAIDMDVLADLTDGELAQIGVPLGDRKRLLKAVASLSKIEPGLLSKEGAPPAEANLLATPTPLSPAAGRDPERRAQSQRCSAISWAPPPFRPGSTPRIGAISSARTSTQRRRR